MQHRNTLLPSLSLSPSLSLLPVTTHQDASTAAKVLDVWEEAAWARHKSELEQIGGLPDVHYTAEPPSVGRRRLVKGTESDMLWAFVEGLVSAEVPAAISQASSALSEVLARVGMALEDAATNARDLRRAERAAADERLQAMRVSYESRLRELGARHHADVEAWKRRELNKVRDAAVAEVRRVQVDADRVCGEAAMQARVASATSDGLVVRVRECQSDAAEFAAALDRTGAAAQRRASAGVRRMVNAKMSRVFNAWRLVADRGVLGVRVETLTTMLEDSQARVVQLRKDMEDDEGKWERRVNAVSKMAKCHNVMFFMDTCRAAISVWARRARRTASRHVRAGPYIGPHFSAAPQALSLR